MTEQTHRIRQFSRYLTELGRMQLNINDVEHCIVELADQTPLELLHTVDMASANDPCTRLLTKAQNESRVLSLGVGMIEDEPLLHCALILESCMEKRVFQLRLRGDFWLGHIRRLNYLTINARRRLAKLLSDCVLTSADDIRAVLDHVAMALELTLDSGLWGARLESSGGAVQNKIRAAAEVAVADELSPALLALIPAQERQESQECIDTQRSEMQ